MLMDSYNRDLILITLLVVLDQLSKFWVESVRPEIDLGFASIHYVINTGAGFGILQGNNTLLIFVSLIVLGLLMMNAKSISSSQTLPLILVVSGLLGNLIDRSLRGHVVDFFDLGWFPVFNIADSCISIGVVWLIILMIMESQNEKKPRTNSGKKQTSRA